MLETSRLENEMQNAIFWMKDYVERANAKGVVVGLSGGKDSSVVLAMATKALGKERVLAIAMPCSSLKNDLEDAKLVADTFDVNMITIDLEKPFIDLEISARLGLGQDLCREAKINTKPRLRMATLYAVAQTVGYLVVGTGNLCEAMVGYTTKWGDNSSDFNPIANFTVNEVLAMGKLLGVPDKILKKAPNDGLGGRTDEEKMGVTYQQIEEMIETGDTEEQAKEIILHKNQISKHKRSLVPSYSFDRVNYLK